MKRFGSKLLMAEQSGYTFFQCPGCNDHHALTVKGGASWGWNGSGDAPTFTPSVLVPGTYKRTRDESGKWDGGYQRDAAGQPIPMICHSFITDGRIQFLGDCTHALAGQTVDLPDWPEAESA